MASFEISSFPPADAPRASRVCVATGRAFQPGEKIHSVLYEENGTLKRDDLCAEAWRSYKRPETTVAWWTSRVAEPEEKKTGLTPNDALVSLFESLVFKPDQADLRYALALLLVRRHVFRFEFENAAQSANSKNKSGQESIFVYSPRNDACYATPVVAMDEAKIADVQNRLVALLDAPPNQFTSSDEVAQAAAAAVKALGDES